MLPSTHIILGGLISALLFFIFPKMGVFGFAIIFLASVLIDFDHYVYYGIRNNDWSLKNAYSWFIRKGKILRKMPLAQRNEYQKVLMIFHGIECLTILAVLIFVNKIFLFILIGFLIHLFLDFIDLARYKEPFYVKSSQILVYTRNKNKKRFV